MTAQLDEITEWRSAGAVLCEVPDELWERYQRATREYFDALTALRTIYEPAARAQTRVVNGRILIGDDE